MTKPSIINKDEEKILNVVNGEGPRRLFERIWIYLLLAGLIALVAIAAGE